MNSSVRIQSSEASMKVAWPASAEKATRSSRSV